MPSIPRLISAPSPKRHISHLPSHRLAKRSHRAFRARQSPGLWGSLGRSAPRQRGCSRRNPATKRPPPHPGRRRAGTPQPSTKAGTKNPAGRERGRAHGLPAAPHKARQRQPGSNRPAAAQRQGAPQTKGGCPGRGGAARRPLPGAAGGRGRGRGRRRGGGGGLTFSASRSLTVGSGVRVDILRAGRGRWGRPLSLGRAAPPAAGRSGRAGPPAARRPR